MDNEPMSEKPLDGSGLEESKPRPWWKTPKWLGIIGGCVGAFVLLVVAISTGEPTGGGSSSGYSRLPTTLNNRYKERDASEWAVLLNDADWSTCVNGAFGLYYCGDEGLRFLADGMKSPITHVRWKSVELLPPAANKYPGTFRPLLKEIAEHDPSEDVRKEAAQRLSQLSPT